MFERRLKIFLAILLLVTGVMLLRAAQLQVFGGNHWQQQAVDSMKRSRLIETTRGRILDAKNRPIAADEGCMDAAVDFRALTDPPDPEWLTVQATGRLRNQLGDAYGKLSKDERERRLKDEKDGVLRDIAEMWKVLARESGQTVEQIEETRRSIVDRVQMRRRYVWYHKYRQAVHEKKGDSAGAPWYAKWLMEGDANGPDLDNFVEDVGEQEAAHPILHDIPNDLYMKLRKSVARYPGLSFPNSTDRRYLPPYNDVASHVLGRLSKVMQEDIREDPNLGKDELREYLKNDLIGRTGLEALCEPALRGTRGRVVRAAGDATTELARVESIAGADVRTTLDMELQRDVQGLFKKVQLFSRRATNEPIQYFEMHGGAVVIDVASGAVRAMASWPNYDANTFDARYAELSSDELNKPLLNRAAQWAVEPGSTVKPIVGLGAITDGLFDVNHGIECTGYLVLRGKEQRNNRCWVANQYVASRGRDGVKHHPIPVPHRGHDGNPDGFLTFSDAIERSCNVYFETVADKMGFAGLDRWFRRFGLGRPTGIGIEEARGLIPSGEGLSRAAIVSDTWNASIGQGQVGATVLQMANVAATIARDGTWVRPRIVEPGTPTRAGAIPDGPDRVDLKLAPAALAALKRGMSDVVYSDGGTATFFDDREQRPPVRLAGKTGSAQTPRLTTPVRGPRGELTFECAECRADWPDAATKECGETDCPSRVRRVRRQTYEPPGSIFHPDGFPKWYRGFGQEGRTISHAWFIGYAPAEKPQIAFAVMVEYGGSGGFAAASVAAPMIDACIQHGYLTATPAVAAAR